GTSLEISKIGAGAGAGLGEGGTGGFGTGILRIVTGTISASHCRSFSPAGPNCFFSPRGTPHSSTISERERLVHRPMKKKRPRFVSSGFPMFFLFSMALIFGHNCTREVPL